MRIAIIGKSFIGLEKHFESQNISFVVFKDRKKQPKVPKQNVIYIDFANIEAVSDAVKKSHSIQHFDCAITIFEQYIVATSKINVVLGTPGLPPESAEACTNKFIMRSLFAKTSKKISPDFQIVTSTKTLMDFAEKHSFPLILKPANLAKSLLVTKSNNLNELLNNYQKMLGAIDRVYLKYAPHNQKIILIEEFLEGSIHSVDAFVDNNGNPKILPHIVDYQTGYDIGYDDNFHYSRIVPSTLPEDIQKEFFSVADTAIRSLGMKNSAAHVEIIVTADGPRIVEIGARNGGYRERLHSLAHGIDIYDNLIRINTGQPLKIKSTKNEHCAVLELFPKTPGNFIGLENEEKLRQLKSLEYVSIKYEIGEYAGKSSEGYKAVCIIILHNTDKKAFDQDIEFVNASVSVITS